MIVNRRSFIGGAGALVALPFLASLFPRRARAALPPQPRRLICMYAPNGMHMPSWTPASEGAGWSSLILDDLGDMKAHALVVSGLQNLPGRPDGIGDHGAGTGAYLTCTHVAKTEGDDIQNGVSIDQLAAPVLGAGARFQSLELGLEGGGSVGGCDSGYSCAYTRNIAWAGPKTPLPQIANPRVLFDRLVAGTDPNETAAVRLRRKTQRKSVLDWVKADANSLDARLASDDRQKLDEYLTGLRKLEETIALASTEAACAAPGEPPAGYDTQAQMDLMIELLVMALRCDLTRVATFMLANAGSGRSYAFVDPTIVGGHHDLSHHMDNPENFRQLEIIDRWEVRQVAQLARRLHAEVDETGASLLDQSLIYLSSEISDGNSHTHTDLPVVLLGKAGGSIQPGRHIRRAEQPMANLFVSMLASVGVDVASFGDSTGSLDLG